MRKLFILSALCLLCMTPVRASVVLDATNFPDPVFRIYVSGLTGVSVGRTISDAKLANVKEIKVVELGITSLKGVEYFTNLTLLNCINNQLTSLDVTQNSLLEELYCSNNQLTTLDVSHNTKLEDLQCRNNNLTSLDVTKNTLLSYFRCENNILTSLDVSKNVKLTSLFCEANRLTALDVSRNTELGLLKCENNSISSLDVSNNTKLNYLDCSNNKLTSLDVSKNSKLEKLLCRNNQLTSLDVTKNPKLVFFSCGYNKLKSLDVSKNTLLVYLYCYGNQLTSLDVSKNTALTNLSCGGNQISSLALSGLAALEELLCSDNKIAQLNLSNNTKLKTIECHGNCLTYLNLDNCPLIETSEIKNQISTRRFQIMSNGSNENDCWALYVGTSDASRIKDLKIDGVETEPEMLTKDPGWMVVSNDRKKIPLKVTYKIYTGNETAGWMVVTVNYDVKKYGVYVDGKELTSLNFYDIPGLKSGTAYLKDEPEGIGWSGYLPTLALSDAKIEGEEGIRNEQAYYLKIIVKGDNEVTATDYNAFANNTASVETVFSGGGTVRFTATGDRWNGIYAIDSRMTLKEWTTVMAKGDGHGYFDDNSTLVMQENSKLIAYGNQYPSVELPLADQRKWDANIGVRYPEGAYIGDRFHVFYAGTTKDVQKDWVLIGPEGATLPADLLGNPADVNQDGTVDSADIVAVIKEMPDGDKKADVNGDTVIDSADIVAVIKAMK